jgi:hypothetical protein
MSTEKKNNYVEAYMTILEGLSNEIKLELISRLKENIDNDINDRKKILKAAYGSWVGEESAEELIDLIRECRVNNPLLV